MDVRAKNRGRPHQKVHSPAAPVVGRNFLTPGHLGVRVGNVRRNPDQKFMFMSFFLPENLSGGARHVSQRLSSTLCSLSVLRNYSVNRALAEGIRLCGNACHRDQKR